MTIPSHLVWGVWIEICYSMGAKGCQKWSHLVWGVWIEMLRLQLLGYLLYSHTSYEVCGLKCCIQILQARSCQGHTSYEVCGLKLEVVDNTLKGLEVTPRMRCVDWNRHPIPASNLTSNVTPRMRCVDWNSIGLVRITHEGFVTPRMRCVDWNTLCVQYPSYTVSVTPRMRCVDWNWSMTRKTVASCSSHTSYEVCGLK